MHHTKLLVVVSLCYAMMGLLACQASDEEGRMISQVEIVTREVTREVTVPAETGVITQVVMVAATPEPPRACAPQEINERDEIVIGAILPLSMPGAMHSGFAMQTALNIAVEDVNADGGVQGKPVRLISYDSAGTAEQGARFAERLILQDCVSTIVGAHHAEVGSAVEEVTARYGIPAIFTGAYEGDQTESQTAEVFRIGPSKTLLSQLPGKWMAEIGDYNGDGTPFVVSIVENNSSGASLAELVDGQMSAYGFEHEIFGVDLPTTDFSPIIARIVTLDKLPDAIFLYMMGDSVFDLQRQLQEAGLGPDTNSLIVTTPIALQSDRFWEAVPDGRLTVIQKMGPWKSTVMPLGTSFAETYRTHFNRWPEAHAFAAYDSLSLAVDAMNRSATIAPDDVIAALEESNVALASGRYTFPNNGQNPASGTDRAPSTWHQWPDYPLLLIQYTEPQQPSSAAPVIWPDAYRTTDQAVFN